MRRLGRQGEIDDGAECWSLKTLRTLRDHTEVMTVIYDDLRPLGKGIVKVGVIGYGWFAGLDVLEQVVTLT